jgi:hypothetical protein
MNTAQRAELRALLVDVADVVDLDPEQPFDIGEDASPALIAVVKYALTHGARLRAVECYGGQWLIDSRIMQDLRRLATG